jgi:acetyl-CoA C-acetyltransferase
LQREHIGKAYIVRFFSGIPPASPGSKSTAQLRECALGLADAGLSKADVDGYFCAGDTPGNICGDGPHGPARP